MQRLGTGTSLPVPAAQAVTIDDASALVGIGPTGNGYVVTEYLFNSTGAGINAGPISTGRIYVDVLGNNGYIGTVHLTMWHVDGDANDPMWSVRTVKVIGYRTRLTVACFDPAGVPINVGQFFLTYTNRSRPDKGGTTAPSLVRLTTTYSTVETHRPTTQYRSSGTARILVHRQDPCTYQVRVPGGALPAETVVRFSGTDATPTTAIVISGYGPHRCNLHRDASGSGDPIPYLYVVARCINVAGGLLSQSVSASNVLAA